MKISEHIALLEKFKDEFGDLIVCGTFDGVVNHLENENIFRHGKFLLIDAECGPPVFKEEWNS